MSTRLPAGLLSRLTSLSILPLALLLASACGSSGGGASTPDAPVAEPDAARSCVIDGIVSPTEQCDDGNMISGDGCENDCSFTCTVDAECGDHDPCNGVETCTAAHTCMPGTPPAAGTDCGGGNVCKFGKCSAVACGDGFVDVGEDCDDGNVNPNDGCDMCHFGCTDNTKCQPTDSCAGVGMCDLTMHKCAPLTPAMDNTACTGGFCKGGVCTTAVCGNGIKEPGEVCDDGNLMDGDGCDKDCTFSCVTPATDCAPAAACTVTTCSTGHVCQNAPDPTQNTHACGMPGNTCQNGACLPPGAVCGNGIVETGEQCDFGTGNGPGTGCETSCSFSCTKAPDSCVDANSCNGVEACTTVTVSGHTGQKCNAGTQAANCTACTGGLCGGGMCKASTCGDGCVNATAGETCDPPNTATCDAACHLKAVCGNGVREGTEQCDDGATTNLDGCSATCTFEQGQRVNFLKMQFATDTLCTTNALGGAISGLAQGTLQTALDTGIKDGTIDIVLEFLGLDDLSGTADASVSLGFVNATPETRGGTLTYDGTSDLDWWHNALAAGLDANRVPTASLVGAIAAKVLTAGPGKVIVDIIIAGSPAPLSMSSTRVKVTIGAVSTPGTSTADPPGHLAAEHLNPALQSFGSTGQQTTTGAGELCGNVSASSLSKVPAPMALQTGGSNACDQGYTAANSLLDVIVNGCTVLGFVTVITSTNPDTSDGTVPVAGAGAPYKLSVNASKNVTTCKDKSNATVTLATCLDSAAYSSFFKFTTNRAIIK